MGKLTAELNNHVAAQRVKRKLTQEQLARAADVSRQTIIAIEGGMYNPSTILVLRLSFLLDVSVNELFSFPEAALVELQDKRRRLYLADEREQEK
ncbi:MAG: helix-turn-helix transcriptional regulator [Ktedonobacteraceae bacterium]